MDEIEVEYTGVFLFSFLPPHQMYSNVIHGFLIALYDKFHPQYLHKFLR